MICFSFNPPVLFHRVSPVCPSRYDITNRTSDMGWIGLFRAFAMVSSAAWHLVTRLRGSCLLLHVLLIPMLIICRVRDDSLASVSASMFPSHPCLSSWLLVHGLCCSFQDISPVQPMGHGPYASAFLPVFMPNMVRWDLHSSSFQGSL